MSTATALTKMERLFAELGWKIEWVSLPSLQIAEKPLLYVVEPQITYEGTYEEDAKHLKRLSVKGVSFASNQEAMENTAREILALMEVCDEISAIVKMIREKPQTSY